ncbi:prolyl oligopeptidase family serine peptidase [Flavobacterium sp. GT3P67]|uniref:S9 family peptidase n=1 Tax=Flavobacterium sp. GT3P67 TaxID=2541722 RepID=UPI0010523E0E|nr:prolyl oligopeptidase family serine peptidase [Flavobacterium sp. GT3P67]TDE51269.1 S9 family peptidase [Flavobacterium sp. GT3P67]
MKLILKINWGLTYFFLFVFQAGFSQPERRIPALDEYVKWHTLVGEGISPDGKWINYNFDYQTGNDTLFVQKVKAETKYIFPNGTNPMFSIDGKWFTVYNESKGLAILNLNSGQIEWIPNVIKHEFSPTGKSMALYIRTKNIDVLTLRHLSDKKEQSFHNVKSFVFSAKGKLAMVTKNDILIIDEKPNSKVKVVMTAAENILKKTMWSTSGKFLCFLQELPKDEGNQPNHKVVCYDTEKNSLTFLNPLEFDSLKHQRITSASLSVSESGNIYFYRQSIDTVPSGTDTVQVWESDTPYEYPKQKVVGDTRTMPLLTVWFPQSDNVIHIGTTDAPLARLTLDRNFALTYNRLRYEPQYERTGPADIYSTDLQSGTKKLLLSNHGGNDQTLLLSPDSKCIAYFKEQNWWIYDFYKGSHVNLTKNWQGTLNNLEYDNAGPSYGYGSPGFTLDQKYLIIYDKYDVWLVAVDGGLRKRITSGAKSKIRFRLCENIGFNSIHLGTPDFSVREFDTRKGIFLQAIGENKSSGFYIYRDQKLKNLLFKNTNNDRLKKAADAERLIFVEQSASIPPRLWLLDAGLKQIREMVKSNTHTEKFESGTAEIIKYNNSKGQDLNGALFYPVGYEKGKKYPMVVYIYEKLSDEFNKYHNPSLFCFGELNIANYALDGYFVLLPDIVYEVGNPGQSASDCVEAAVKAVIDRGQIHADRIGIMGHSFGGYETSFIISKSSTFATAVAGAAITDLPRSYLTMNFSTGLPNIWRFETQQLRMGKSLYDDFSGYLQNSPVAQAASITTPLLSYTGDNDKSVDWQQSIALHLALRRLKKVSRLIVYPGEGHVIVKSEFQFDLEKRIKDWFDFYLK